MSSHDVFHILLSVRHTNGSMEYIYMYVHIYVCKYVCIRVCMHTSAGLATINGMHRTISCCPVAAYTGLTGGTLKHMTCRIERT